MDTVYTGAEGSCCRSVPLRPAAPLLLPAEAACGKGVNSGAAAWLPPPPPALLRGVLPAGVGGGSGSAA
jgi:hypothetical protein